MFDRGSSWNGQNIGRPMQEPGERYLCVARTVCLGDSVKHLAGDFTSSQREPRYKGNSAAFTIVHHVVPFAIRKAVAVLHRDDRNDSTCSLDVLLCDVGQADQANLAFVSQLSESFHRCLKRDTMVGNMQLIKIDAVKA